MSLTYLAASPAYSLAQLPLGWEVMAALVARLRGQSAAEASFILSSRDLLRDALCPTKIHVES